MADATNECESVVQPLWQFSLCYYRQARIAETCVELQDQAGADVNLLLFLLWQATRQRTLSIEEIRLIQELVACWRLHVVAPLRTARRALKQPNATSIVSDAESSTLAKEILAAELKAERMQQNAIFRFSKERSLGIPAISSRNAAENNIHSYQTVLGAHFAATNVELLVDGLCDFVLAGNRRDSPES